MNGDGVNGGESQVDVDMAFWCKIDNVRVVASVLNTLIERKDKKTDSLIGYVEITPSMMIFTVERGRSLQANAYLSSDLFQEYHFIPPSDSAAGSDCSCGDTAPASGSDTGEHRNEANKTVRHYCFRIDFSVMWECLDMFMTSVSYTALQVAYGGYGSALFLLLEQGDLTTKCSIRTFDNEDHPVLSMTDPVAEIIVDSDLLKDAFAELDWSCDAAQLSFSPSNPCFRLSSEGHQGSCVVEYPMDAQQKLFKKFRCRQEVSARYRMSSLRLTIKALANAKLTQLQLDARGHLKFQHMIQNENEKQSFVDFYVMPEEGTMDDEEDEYDDITVVTAAGVNSGDRLGLLGNGDDGSAPSSLKQSPATSSKQDFSARGLLEQDNLDA